MGLFDNKKKAVPQPAPRQQQNVGSIFDNFDKYSAQKKQQEARDNMLRQERENAANLAAERREAERKQREIELAARQQAERIEAAKHMENLNTVKTEQPGFGQVPLVNTMPGDFVNQVSAAMKDNSTPIDIQATAKLERSEQRIGPTAEIEMSLVGASSVIGRREYQQDMICTSRNDVKGSFKEKWLAVLCDGMGGMNGGEKASFLCAHRMLSSFNQQLTEIPRYFRNKIVEIDREVSELTDENGQPMGAGSTFISIIIDGDNLYWSSVGDSHIYIMRGNEFVQVNREHNYLAELLERAARGEITVEEAYNDRQREALTSYMGIGGVSLMDVIEKPFSLQKGDIIILCSDGLYRSLSDAEIFGIVSQNITDMPAAANALTAAAMAKNFVHQDNTSVITVRYQ